MRGELAGVPNYVRLSSSRSPLQHRFRDISKRKWLAGEFKPPHYHPFHYTGEASNL